MTPKLAGGDIAADIAAGRRRVRDPPPTMKRSTAVVLVVASLGTLYVGGYWGLMKQGLIAKLPGGGDPTRRTRVYVIARQVFEPLMKLDDEWSFHRPIKRRLKGNWQSATKDDFVRITDDGHGSFRLGDFTYAGPLNYDSGGFCTEFQHKGSEHLFVFAPDLYGPLDRAIAIVRHDIRVTDYHGTMTKEKTGPDEAERSPARPNPK